MHPLVEFFDLSQTWSAPCLYLHYGRMVYGWLFVYIHNITYFTIFYLNSLLFFCRICCRYSYPQLFFFNFIPFCEILNLIMQGRPLFHLSRMGCFQFSDTFSTYLLLHISLVWSILFFGHRRSCSTPHVCIVLDKDLNTCFARFFFFNKHKYYVYFTALDSAKNSSKMSLKKVWLSRINQSFHHMNTINYQSS